ncbi:hypothetical protein [Paenibacillus alba]|uniref:Uncharacterized protein n=1 Tax=Paenibacillus alba TaxID=1197127 RepID=A0ABU6FZJ5_9BACL|nr:hypothetical protein [Paenibacillus alba]MEC0227327.1 hypothetical protein [Paenibacillus alba]
MENLWNFIIREWQSIALLVGVLFAIWFVYKHKDKLIRGTNDKK